MRPDVITIDVRMPRLDGFDTVARLRADPRTADLKIAMVTACAQDGRPPPRRDGRRRRVRDQAVRPEHAGAHGPRPGRAQGLLTAPDNARRRDPSRALRRRTGRRRRRLSTPASWSSPCPTRSRSSDRRSRSTATTRRAWRCSSPSRPAGRRARSPRPSPRSCARPRRRRGRRRRPGFLNITLDSAAQGELARTVVDGRRRPTAARRGSAGHRFNLEFVSANPTGPLHLGHVRWAAVGDALARILQLTGAEVTREYYFNDAGVQIDRFAGSLLAAAQGKPTPEDGYGGDYIGEIAAAVVAADPGVLDLPDDEAACGVPARGHGADVRRDPPVARRLRRALRRLLQREGPAREGRARRRPWPG